MRAKPYAVVRSVSIQAPTSRVHAMIADLRAWVLWSPWEGRDVGVARRFSEVAAGAGAWFEWEGNFKAGKGRMEILEDSDDGVLIDMIWERSVASEQQLSFRLEPEGDGTKVTLTTHGEISGAFRVVAYLFPMSRIHGPTFERGLARLKAICEQ